jgi:hypothetical protein
MSLSTLSWVLNFQKDFLVCKDIIKQLLLLVQVVIRSFSLLQISCLLIAFYDVWISKKEPYRIFINSWVFFFIVEFQWFLIELSVLPRMILVISAHLFPWAVWAKKRTHYSCNVQSTFNILGLRWLCHLYLHCLPNLPVTNLAMKDHLWGPYFSTNFFTSWSSYSVQGFLRSMPSHVPSSGLAELSWFSLKSLSVFLPIKFK